MKCLQKRNEVKNKNWKISTLEERRRRRRISGCCWSCQCGGERDGVVTERNSRCREFLVSSHFVYISLPPTHNTRWIYETALIVTSTWGEFFASFFFSLATYHWLFKELGRVDENGFSGDDDYARSSRFVWPFSQVSCYSRRF